jgi:phosphoribosylglycinamide formyltransferase-1
MTTKALAIAVSGGGSNLQAVIDAIAAGVLPLRIAVVISDRPDCGGVLRAAQQRLPVCAIPYPRRATPAERLAWESQMIAVLQSFAPDMLLLAGFMRILSAATLATISVPIINQHPALLPADGGEVVATHAGHRIPALRGAHVVADALAQSLPVTGCTVHYVVPAVDRGPVIATREVPILATDTVDTLHARIRSVEQPLLIETLQHLCQ